MVAISGALLGFAANALSPRRLNLTRNYFPDLRSAATNAVAGTNVVGGLTASNAPSVLQLLQQVGLRAANSNDAAQFYTDPRRQLNLLAFIDARTDEHYQQGHIPGAYLLDWYRVENYIPTVLPACQMAQEIMVYCNGGECDDSIKAATFLREAGVPADKLRVYVGGFSEWSTNRMPIELGQRNSGNVRNN